MGLTKHLVPTVIATLVWAGVGQAQTIEYYHLDTLGSVRAVTAHQSGQVVERHDYLPYGEEWCGMQPCGASGGQPKHFTGKERDVETGLDYFEARHYGSSIGRFTTIDPKLTVEHNIADPQRWNRYAYCRDNPLRFVDPDGRDWLYRTVMGTFFGPTYVQQHGDRSSVPLLVEGAGADVSRIGPPFVKEQVGTVATIAASEVLGAVFLAEALPAGSVARTGLGLFEGSGATGAPIAGYAAALPRSLAAGALGLRLQLANELQMTQVMSGGGRAIIGAGTRTPLDDAARLANTYGGAAGDWAKVRSFNYKEPGYSFEVHAYKNVNTGLVVEPKTKFQ
jgi:RHS repeat-associated protein